MTTEEFRRHGHAVIDWIARYLEEVEQYPVLSPVKPGEVRAKLPGSPPMQGEPFAAIMQDFAEIVLPGVTHWQSPNFFAYFPTGVSYPSILGELLSAGLGIQGMLWTTSPACTELETHVLDWLADMLALPARFKSTSTGGGVIQDTASNATLCALLAARERASDFATNRTGIGRRFIAYGSTQTHSSLDKAMMIAGMGTENLRKVEVDDAFAMMPEALEKAILMDKAAGHMPCFVCGTVGTTSSNAFDPLRPIGEITRKHGLWFHVDAAMSGTAALCPEYRWMHEGLELADSYCFNPHKWMFVNFDCDAFYVADRAALIRTLSILPEYLRNQATEAGAVFDYRDWHVQLGRRFRALKLWFVIRSFGVAGLQERIREHVRLTQQFASWVKADPRFEIAAPHPLNLVCFRHRGGDEVNQRLMDRLNTSGKLFLSHTKLHGKLTLRMSIGAPQTEERHVRQAWELMQAMVK